jgi:hypothetical protein
MRIPDVTRDEIQTTQSQRCLGRNIKPSINRRKVNSVQPIKMSPAAGNIIGKVLRM